MGDIKKIKSDYQDVVSFVKSVLSGDDPGEKLLFYYLSCVFKIWGSNALFSKDYLSLVYAVSNMDYTVEQMLTAMGCCGDPERIVAVPDFFKTLISADINEKTDSAEQFVKKWNSLLFESAMINGDYTVQKNAALETIVNGLVGTAEDSGLAITGVENHSAQVTERNNNYFQNDALLRAAAETKYGAVSNSYSPLSSPAAPPQSAPSTINVTLNISSNAATEEGSNTQISPPEEEAKVTVPTHNNEETLESLLEELDGLVGLGGVKSDVHSLINFIKVTKIRESRGMKVPTISYHLVFTGNPGTGKTTVARLVAKLYYHMGILPQGQLVETDRSALVAGYLGQTAIKTQKVIQQAMGGVLFIDEAYSLAGETDDSYGKEAVETILKAMEDHRDEFVVIVAGYTNLMHKFIDSNPGLSSRFSKYFEFPDYCGEELILIFDRFCKKNGYVLKEDARALLKSHFDSLFEMRDEHFGNARTARNIFEKAINAQANRIASIADIDNSDLENITVEDINVATGGALS